MSGSRDGVALDGRARKGACSLGAPSTRVIIVTVVHLLHDAVLHIPWEHRAATETLTQASQDEVHEGQFSRVTLQQAPCGISAPPSTASSSAPLGVAGSLPSHLSSFLCRVGPVRWDHPDGPLAQPGPAKQEARCLLFRHSPRKTASVSWGTRKSRMEDYQGFTEMCEGQGRTDRAQK